MYGLSPLSSSHVTMIHMGALDFIIFCPQRSTLTCPVRKPHASPIVKTANSAWNWQTLYVPPNHARTYVLYSAAILLSWLPVVEVGCARIHSMANAAPLSCVQFRNSLSLKLRKHSFSQLAMSRTSLLHNATRVRTCHSTRKVILHDNYPNSDQPDAAMQLRARITGKGGRLISLQLAASMHCSKRLITIIRHGGSAVLTKSEWDGRSGTNCTAASSTQKPQPRATECNETC